MRAFIIAFLFTLQSMGLCFAFDGDTELQKGKSLVMQGENMQAAYSLRKAGQSSDSQVRNMAAFWLDYADIPSSRSNQKIEDAFFYASMGNRDAIYHLAEEAIEKNPLSIESHKALAILYLTQPQFCMSREETCYYQSIPYAAKHEIWILEALAVSPQEKLQAMDMQYQYYMARARAFACQYQCTFRGAYAEQAQDFRERAQKKLREIKAYEAKLKKAGIAPGRAGE